MTEQYCPHTCHFIFQYCVEIAYLLYHKSMIYIGNSCRTIILTLIYKTYL